jgi:two-component system sensor histidine kinase TctE
MPAAPSLRRTLLTNLLLPTLALAIVLGIGGAFLVRKVVDATSDRLLFGSVLAIAERISVEDGDVTVDLPPVALGMLQSQSHDSIYYSVTYDRKLVAGYDDLPLGPAADLGAGQTVSWNATYRGNAVRFAAQARKVYGVSQPVLTTVGETRTARRQVEFEMLLGLAAIEAGLLGLAAALGWYAVDRGLLPLADLRRQINRRGLVGARDLTPLDLAPVPREVRSAAEAINGLLERLRNAIEIVRRFTGDASHQLRSPLAHLRVHLDLVRRHGSTSGPGQAAMKDVFLAVERLERLIAQLLSLTRADEADLEHAREANADIVEILMTIFPQLLQRADIRRIALEFDGTEGPVMVKGDPLLVSEILSNVIDNAIRYNYLGGSVRVCVVPRERDVQTIVEDSGPGIPQEERARVFQRFYRIARTGGANGSGLGLSIVRTLAGHLDATVALADGPRGQGLSVTVTFPRATGLSSEAPQHAQEAPAD